MSIGVHVTQSYQLRESKAIHVKIQRYNLHTSVGRWTNAMTIILKH